jgi:hypothetical protein
MLNLNYLNINIDKAREEHFHFFGCYVTKKITGNQCVKTVTNSAHPDRPVLCKGSIVKSFTPKSGSLNTLKKFIFQKNRLKKVLIGSPIELEKVNREFEVLVNRNFGAKTYENYLKLSEKQRPNFSNPNVHEFFQDINSIFNYDRLSKDNHYSSYKLTENLGVRSCVYCNRTYALTHRRASGDRLMNPQLDHWFPQSKYPLLQVSFSNLIPSCEVCNSRVKSDTQFQLKEYFHPYQKEKEEINFRYKFSSGTNRYKIFFSDNSGKKVKKTCQEMFIDEMYDSHQYELDDLIKIRQAYSPKYLKNIKTSFPSANLSDEEIYRLAFGTEIYKEEFHKRPFSKFKHDILIDLGIIKDGEN